MKAEKTSFWVLIGPALLLAMVVLLLFKIAPLLGRPVWLFGLSISSLLASGISYLTFKEIGRREKDLQLQGERTKKESEDLRSVLDATHLLYREKIAKLEEAFSASENE